MADTAFYNGLARRADNLLKRFGTQATLVSKETGAFDPATGRATRTNTNTLVTVVFQPIRADGSGMTEFREEIIAKCNSIVIMSAVDGVVPEVEDELLHNTDRYKVFGVTPISPAKVDVVYKLAVGNG